MKLLITGCTGFIGSTFCKLALKETDWRLSGVARGPLTDFQLAKLEGAMDEPRFNLVYRDLTGDISGIVDGHDVVVHFAAKTFVDYSIRDPKPFMKNNQEATRNLLEECRHAKPKLFVNVSTDEVYGAILDGAYTEDARINPTNPYAASKAAQDADCLAYANTYNLPLIITRTENNYGPFQGPEKVLPTFTRKALAGEPLPVYGDGKHRRQWLHVSDHCRAILHLIELYFKGGVQTPQIYHVAGCQELENLELARLVLEAIGKPQDAFQLIEDANIRPGHDRRYALNVDKLRATGWEAQVGLKDGIAETVRWYRDHAAIYGW